jgi:N-acetylmuramoyl-L-alanine amidase
MRKPNFKKLFASSALALALVCTLGLSVNAAQATENTKTASVAAESRIALPSGSEKTDLVVNGRQVLSGRVFTLSGVTYVPMKRFADWLGVFSYQNSTKSGTRTTGLTGTNLKIEAVENSLYISANDRYFYTVGQILEIGDELYVPIYPLVKALNCYVDYNSSQNSFMVRSGDTSLVKHDWQVYNSNDVYWLARIISAEARGESLKGKMAVGNVVLNRVASAEFPNTVRSVVFDTKNAVQFEPTANGTIYLEPTAQSVLAARLALSGANAVDDCLYFFSPALSQGTWIRENRSYYTTIGCHRFYR